jgi:hypothetical protein
MDVLFSPKLISTSIFLFIRISSSLSIEQDSTLPSKTIKEEFTFEYYINNYGMCEDDEGRRYYTPTSMEEYNSYLWAAFAPSSEE